MSGATTPIHVYIHIPFCAAKCHYCAFYSHKDQPELHQRYLQAIQKEFLDWITTQPNVTIDTLYIGGGTPSLLSADLLTQLLATIWQHCPKTPNCEVTIEANPESITAAKLQAYHQIGINRLSVGVQAWQSHQLKRLNRPYQIGDFLEVSTVIAQSKLTNYNLDLIFGLPQQTLNEWQSSLTQTIALNPTHISCYSLELDNHSRWGRLHQIGKIKTPSIELDRHMLRLAETVLAAAGYHRYEISNYAKPGFACRHNQSFWQNQDFRGFGAGAASKWQGQTWTNVAHTLGYCQLIEARQSTSTHQSSLSKTEILLEKMSLGLRLAAGIDLADLTAHVLPNKVAQFQKTTQLLCDHQLLTCRGSRLKPTVKGWDVLDQVITTLAASWL